MRLVLSLIYYLMFSFNADGIEKAIDQTPFFHQEKHTSLFSSDQNQEPNSAFSLFNQFNLSRVLDLSSKKSIIQDLDDYQREEALKTVESSPFLNQPTQRQSSDQSSNSQSSKSDKNQVIQEAHQSSEQTVIGSDHQQVLMAESHEFTRGFQTDPQRSQSPQINPNKIFHKLINSKVSTRDPGERKSLFNLNFKKEKKQPQEQKTPNLKSSLNQSQQSTKKEERQTSFEPKMKKIEVKFKEKTLQPITLSSNLFSKNKFVELKKEEDEKSKSKLLPRKKTEEQNKVENKIEKSESSNQIKPLSFSLADQIAKRDKMPFNKFPKLNFNKEKEQRKTQKKQQVKIQVQNEEKQKPISKPSISYKQRNSMDKVSSNHEQRTASKILGHQGLLDNRKTISVNKTNKLSQYHNDIERVENDLQSFRVKTENSQEKYKQLHLLSKELQKRVNYEFNKKQA